MLSPAMETYCGNRRSMFTMAFLFILSIAGIYGTMIFKPPYAQFYYAGLAIAIGVFGYNLYWLITLRVGLHPDGISLNSFRGLTEMRWDNVDRFYYSSIKQYVNGIPTGTYYTYKPIDRQGTTISLGHAVENPEPFGRKLIQFTQKPLVSRAIGEYNSGVEVSFGPVKISRTGGVSIKTLIVRKQMPIDQVGSYGMDRGKLYILRKGESRRWFAGTEIRTIPNVFALMALLDAIFQPVASKPQASSPARPGVSKL